jgi:hypothetical protein
MGEGREAETTESGGSDRGCWESEEADEVGGLDEVFRDLAEMSRGCLSRRERNWLLSQERTGRAHERNGFVDTRTLLLNGVADALVLRVVLGDRAGVGELLHARPKEIFALSIRLSLKFDI